MEERLVKLEAKVERLENLVNALITKINMDKFYSDVDINGCRHTETSLVDESGQARADIDYIAMETGVEL